MRVSLKCCFLFFQLMVSSVLSGQVKYSQYVKPMIGTGGHGHTFPGATVPFGMVQLSPDTRIDGSWDGCSGYHHSDSVIYGFSHTHLSGTGCSDYGDILLFPTTRVVKPEDLKEQKFSSTFNHRNEHAEAGYYSVMLNNGVKAELTSSTRVGMHKYTFGDSEFVYLIFDLVLRDKLLGASATMISDTKVKGYRQSEAWARNQTVMYQMEFSEPIVDAFTVDGSVMKQKEPVSGNVRICYKFKMPAKRTLYVKVALSPVSVEGAQKNMTAEIPHWNFEQVRSEASAHWDKELAKIDVTAGADELAVFYTAMYHTMIQPNVAMDVDSMYRGPDMKTHKASGYTHYTVFSLWDTFRAYHPLYALVDQKRTADFINTFLSHYDQSGRLPVWELASNETDCMIGYHSVSVIADAMAKGIKGFDYEKAYAASRHSAMLDHFGLDAYKKNGFISMDDEHESVSKTLEYAYDDWCIAQMAKMLGKADDYNYFIKRSQSWKNIFDPATGFMRPKKNGAWLQPFEPREVNNNFTEGNSWQYSFFVPHDIPGLIETMGGTAAFEKQLDALFAADTKTTGREQADITGLIGQYAQGNEPSHHMIYLYDFIGKPGKVQSVVRKILKEFYTTGPDGLIGNEDCGQMSAWYILSSLGIYPVTPGSTEFKTGLPLFSSATIHFENGKHLKILAKGLSEEKRFVKSLSINSKVFSTTVDQKELVKGGEMVFTMHKQAMELPVATKAPTTPATFLAVPVFGKGTKVFNDSLLVEIAAAAPVFYSTGEGAAYVAYRKPFYIQSSSQISCYAANAVTTSDTIQAVFFKRPNSWKVQSSSAYNAQYTAGGAEGLIDGLRGDVNWRKGEWQGYQYKDMEVVIDLGKTESIQHFSTGFLQDTRSWIIMPEKVEYYVSQDNVHFSLAGTALNSVPADNYDVNVQNLSFNPEKPVAARYVKVKAYNYGKLPQWHQGFGDSAFIFADEIILR